jgi:hypothetical protein
MVKTTNEHKWTRFFNHKTSGATVDRNQINDYEPLMDTDGHEFFDFLNHEIHEKTRKCRSRRRLGAEDEVV